MERAALTLSNAPEVVFRDGLGERRHVVDPTGHDTLEVLSLRAELAIVPSFEFALRERVSRLANFRHGSFGRVRAVERLSDRDATLAIISERTPGVRLSDVVAEAVQRQVPLDINAALCLIRQLLPAVAVLHDNARDVAHGAIGSERLVLTSNGRLVVVEYVAGAALEQLRFSRERYWTDLRIAVPRTAGLSRFDHRVDVTQIGLVALSLILGRPLTGDEYPGRVGDLVSSAWALSSHGGFEPLSPGLRVWLTRALQLDARSAFATAHEAHDEFEKVLADSEYLASQASLEQFLARHHDAGPEPAEPVIPLVSQQPASEPVHKPLAAVSKVVVPSPGVADGSEPAQGPLKPERSATPEAPAHTPKPANPVNRSVVVSAPSSLNAADADMSEFSFAPERKPSSAEGESLAAGEGDADPDSRAEEPARPRAKMVAAIGAALVLLAAIGFLGRRYFAEPPAPVVTTGTLAVNSNPEGVAVIVDGEARGKTPLTLTLEAGAHKVELLADGATRLIPVSISAGAETSQYIELPKAAPDKGQLQVRTSPSGAQVVVDGVARGNSPATVGDLAPGEHTVLVTGALGSVRQKVTIESGTTASLFVPLEAPEGAPVSGWIAVETPVELQVFENGQLIGTSKSDRIMVSTGRHEIEVASDALGYRAARTVQVVAGRVAPIKLELPKGTLAVNAVPWAEVWIDGEKLGDTPIGNVSLSIGPHDVVFRHPELGEQHHSALVTLKGPARLSVDLRKK